MGRSSQIKDEVEAISGKPKTEIFVEQANTTLRIRCNSDAMLDAFILPGAELIVDKCKTPANGDIVCATADGRYTVKFLKKNDVRSWLVPANNKYKEQEITNTNDITIIGVVTSVIIDPSLLRNCMQ